MSKAFPRLDGGLIARKGEAVPMGAAALPLIVATDPATPEARPVPKGLAGTIAVTVRLDPDRYERMKLHGVRQRLSNQQILVAALDAYLPDAQKAAAD